jgi:hypothetical protein
LLGSHASTWARPLCFGNFSNSILHFYPGWLAWTAILLPTATHGYELTSAYNHAQFVVWNGVSLAFCPGWSLPMILLSSVFWVAGITGVISPLTPPLFYLDFKFLGNLIHLSVTYSNLFPLCSENIIHMAWVLFTYWDFLYGPEYGLFWSMIYVHTKENVYSAFFL